MQGDLVRLIVQMPSLHENEPFLRAEGRVSLAVVSPRDTGITFAARDRDEAEILARERAVGTPGVAWEALGGQSPSTASS